MNSFSRFGMAALASGVLAALAACGGGGGGGSGGDGAEQPASVGGLWTSNFTASNGNAIQAKFLVTQDGRFFGASQNLSNNCVGIIYGSLTTGGSNFTGSAVGALVQASVGGSIPACEYADGTTSSTATLSGSVMERSSIAITATGTSSSGLALGTSTTTAQFDALYNMDSSLSTISGSWTGSTGNVLTVGAGGQLVTTDSSTGCTLSGQVSIIDSAYNAYAATGMISNCSASSSALDGASIRALMYIDSTVIPNQLVVGQEITLTDGTKVAAVTTSTR